jgi:hypothetical protein
MTSQPDEPGPREDVSAPDSGATEPVDVASPGAVLQRNGVTEPAAGDLVWPRKVDTLPDRGAEMQALLDGLMPRDGRIPPPRAPVQHGARSEGRDFVAYAGKANLLAGTPTADPLPAVLVVPENNLRELALAGMAEDLAMARAEERAREAAEPTQVLRPKRAREPWVIAVSLGAVALLGAIATLRGSGTARGPAAVVHAPPTGLAPPPTEPTPSPSPTVAASVDVAPAVIPAATLEAPTSPAQRIPAARPVAPRPQPMPQPADPSSSSRRFPKEAP